MNSFYRTTAAVCLLAFCGLESEAALNKKCTFTVEEVEEADYIYANFVRNGKLPTHISEVTRDQQLVDSLTQEVQAREATAAEGACETLVKESNFKTMFHHAFEYENDTPPSYSQLLQDALGAGLAVFGNEYPADNWGEIWKDEEGASLAYFLGSTSTKIGCVIGKCTEADAGDGDRKLFRAARDGASPGTGSKAKNKAVLFCELSPAAAKDSAPFDEEYFNGLIARTAKLEEMTADDLKAPAEDAAAATAVPTILIAGLVAMLAAGSA